MSDKIHNVIIIGSGPAGLTAALYCARANLSPLVLAGVKWGGQLMLTTEVENYPGFVEGIQGPELMQIFRKQAERFGAEIKNEDVTSVDFKSSPFKVGVGETSYQAKSVIIATGAETNWLGLPNEQRLIGRGVSSCAPCDAFFFRGKKVIVVGGGDSAMEEALVLTKFASEVAIVHRRDEFRASKIMQDRAKANPKINFLMNAVVTDVLGQDKVEGVKVEINPSDRSLLSKSKEELEGIAPKQLGLKMENVSPNGIIGDFPVDGIFVAIGHSPMTKIFQGQVELDDKGYVVRKPVKDESTGLFTYKTMTSANGVFVAGDVHDYHYRQAVTAAGYGCQSALEVEKWLEEKN